MIVGNGAIARALTDREDRIYFASGVSNSQEVREEEYNRERTLLLSQSRSNRLVYFSSLCVFTQITRYSTHKMEMEEIVKECFPYYCIMRLGNIDWATNPTQLIPFIKERIRRKMGICILDQHRHVLTKEEFAYWVNLIPDWNCEMNVTGEFIKVKDLIGRYQLSWKNLG